MLIRINEYAHANVMMNIHENVSSSGINVSINIKKIENKQTK